MSEPETKTAEAESWLQGRQYVPAPKGAAPVKFWRGGVNVPEETLSMNVFKSIRRHLPQVYEREPNDIPLMVLAGGPSLNECYSQIVEAYERGVKIVTLNGTHRWCLDRHMVPSIHLQLDARPENAAFVATPIKTCTYLIASQSDAAVFDALRGYDVHIWHAGASRTEQDILHAYYRNQYRIVQLGSTIGVRALSVLRLLGYRDFNLFGYDSCWSVRDHHAYPQPLNENDNRQNVWSAGRKFTCSVWHMKQAEEFLNLLRQRGHLFKIEVQGDGLIAWMMKTGAGMDTAAPHGEETGDDGKREGNPTGGHPV